MLSTYSWLNNRKVSHKIHSWISVTSIRKFLYLSVQLKSLTEVGYEVGLYFMDIQTDLFYVS